MIISVTVVRKPRKDRTCEGIHCVDPHSIEGPAVRLYGCAEPGDPPYVIWVCMDEALRDGHIAPRLSEEWKAVA